MIRAINSEDKKIIIEIIKNEFSTNYTTDSPFTHWLIYEIDNQIIGFINYDIMYDTSEIEYIYVDKKYRNNKIGYYLLKKAIEEIDFHNIKKITLEVKTTNKVAIQFYKKNGFEQVAIRKKYYGNIDAILMMKSW
jgi:ribosomal-protein-alanine N-acetyltransferase